MFFPKHPFRTHGGAKTPHKKNTAEQETVVMPPPHQVTIPMQQHIGAPCEPAVKVGDEVFVGQVVGDSSAFVSAPIHASVSGVVKKILDVELPPGSSVKAVVIESDGKMKKDPSLSPPKVDSPDEFVQAVRNSGLVGLGGAGFPTFIKLSIPEDKQVDTLIINAAECEPYITSDNREALENSWEVLSGIYNIRECLGIDRTIIAVEDNKPEVIRVLSDIAYNDTRDPQNHVRVLKLKSQYPQGAEKVLIKSCTNREVPPGKLPLDIGCIVMNITSVAFLSIYMKTGMPLVSKRITVDGSAIKEPKNVICPLGTSAADLIEFCGGFKGEPKKILMGGPMMGLALKSADVPILKQNNGILAFNETEAKIMEPTGCIRCSKCVSSCPMNLLPYLLEQKAYLRDAQELHKLGVSVCMECGCCAFNCPSRRPLVEAIRLGKSIVAASKKEDKNE